MSLRFNDWLHSTDCYSSITYPVANEPKLHLTFMFVLSVVAVRDRWMHENSPINDRPCCFDPAVDDR